MFQKPKFGPKGENLEEKPALSEDFIFCSKLHDNFEDGWNSPITCLEKNSVICFNDINAPHSKVMARKQKCNLIHFFKL